MIWNRAPILTRTIKVTRSHAGALSGFSCDLTHATTVQPQPAKRRTELLVKEGATDRLHATCKRRVAQQDGNRKDEVRSVLESTLTSKRAQRRLIVFKRDYQLKTTINYFTISNFGILYLIKICLRFEVADISLNLK